MDNNKIKKEQVSLVDKDKQRTKPLRISYKDDDKDIKKKPIKKENNNDCGCNKK